MRIKILRPIPGMAYFGGEISEVPDARASELIAHGNAVMIPEVVSEVPTITEIPVIKAYVRKDEAVNKIVPRRIKK